MQIGRKKECSLAEISQKSCRTTFSSDPRVLIINNYCDKIPSHYLLGQTFSHENENEEEDDLAAEYAPAHILISLLHKALHVVVYLDHLLVCAIDVISDLIERCILVRGLCLEVLGLALDHVGGCEDLVNLFVLFVDVSLLLIQNLAIIKIPGVIIFAILSLGPHHWCLLVHRVAQLVILVYVVA